MPDKHRTFDALSQSEAPGSFRRRKRSLGTAIALIAPHGGKIEPGTSEIADAVAGENFSFYAFEGLKATQNRTLHITSTRFDEPEGCELVGTASTVIAIHGEASPAKIVFLSGRDLEVRQRIRRALRDAGFVVRIHASANLQGTQATNICNRGKAGVGVQLELSKGLRRSFFAGLSAAKRRTKTGQFWNFVNALRAALTTSPGQGAQRRVRRRKSRSVER